MSTQLRWVVVGVCVLLILGLIVWARGDTHHHGDDIGSSLATTVR